MKNFYLCFVLVLFMLSGCEKKVDDLNVKEDAKVSVAVVLDEYFENGLSGLIALSMDCHEVKGSDGATCVGIDVASFMWDDAVTYAMKLPKEDYFSKDNVKKRAREYFSARKMDVNVDLYIENLISESDSRMEIEWERQRHKIK
jgi:hypothetical protein